MKTLDFIKRLSSLDIQLIPEGDHLRCVAPKGAMTQEIAEEIKSRKNTLLRFLDSGYMNERGSIVKLASGDDHPPLFCCHGVSLYASLAKHLEGFQDVYGMFIPAEEESILRASQTSNFEDVKYSSVEEQAAQYIGIMREQDENGPYCLAGLSYGGIIAYEAACQLTRAGQKVTQLLLLDCILPRAVHTSRAGRIKAYLKHVINSGAYSVQKNENRSNDPAEFSGSDEAGDIAVLNQIESMRGDAYWTMSEQYDPPEYSGPVSYIRAQVRYPGMNISEDGGWDGLLKGDAEYFDVAGDHLEILEEPLVNQTAAFFKRRLSLPLELEGSST